jgi:metal-responsive CopG/Arc/MetJ family transcriptional regulator
MLATKVEYEAPTAVRFTIQDLATVDALAEQLGSNRSVFIRMAVRKYIKEVTAT